MRFLMPLVGMIAVAVVAGPALVSRADAADACSKASGAKAPGDKAITACTRVIDDHKASAQARAVAYKSRGNAYSKKNDLDRAIADYGEAIKLDPKMAAAYADRCAAYVTKGSNDLAMADCNQAIQIDPNLALAYMNRGYLYNLADDLDHSLADDSEAIRLDPKDMISYSNRGTVYRNKGDLDQAIADFSEALKLDPKDALSYHSRGLAYFYGGDPAKALADFKQAIALDPKYAYNALWLDIADQRNNTPSPLPQAIAKIDMKAWPAPVIQMFLGQMTPAAVLAAADDPDATKKRDQVCEAEFYSGILAARQGSKDEAARLFRLAAANCPKGYDEAFAAGPELKALGTTN